MEVPKLKFGVTFWLTVTISFVVARHSPGTGVGVNVYTPAAWLSIDDGFHVPAIPFDEEGGNTGTVAPAQMVSAVPKPNVGMVF